MHDGVAGRDPGEAQREPGGVLHVRVVGPGGAGVVPVRRPPAELGPDVGEGQGGGAGGEHPRGLGEHTRAARRGHRRTRDGGVAPRDVLDAEHDPVVAVVRSSAGGGRERRPGARRACAPPRGRPLRTGRCALTEAALTKCRLPSAQVSTDAKPGVKPAVRETASTTGEPHRCSTADAQRRRQVAPLEATRGPAVRDGGGDHPSIFDDAVGVPGLAPRVRHEGWCAST